MALGTFHIIIKEMHFTILLFKYKSWILCSYKEIIHLEAKEMYVGIQIEKL